MIQEIGDLEYHNEYDCEARPEAQDYLLHFSDGRCLTHTAAAEKDLDLPHVSDWERMPAQVTYLFKVGESRVFLCLEDGEIALDGFTYETADWLRGGAVHKSLPQHLLFAAVTAGQLDRWYRDNRFCGRCGHPTELGPRSREIVCPECAKITYPKISPGIICGVLSEDGSKIVMTRYAGRSLALWALVAGFTEIGESIEDTVRREVMEEVGLKIRDLRFYKSQPWSFSDSLLVGFWATVDGDPTITRDGTELKDARWFTQDQIPLERTADTVSVTGEMIEQFRLHGAAVLEN